MRNNGIYSAFAAAALFGASTPFAKLLLGEISPILLAGLLYFGSGVGLSLVRLARHGRDAKGVTPNLDKSPNYQKISVVSHEEWCHPILVSDNQLLGCARAAWRSPRLSFYNS